MIGTNEMSFHLSNKLFAICLRFSDFTSVKLILLSVYLLAYLGAVRLFGNDVRSDHLINADSPPEEEPYKSLEEMEADTIGNLLPDEDDLFSGVVDELGCSSHARTNDDFEDFDLFSSGGGMEMEGDEHLSSGKRMSALDGDFGFFGGYKGKLPFVEQPSRTLFVRNINSNVEDSELKALFEVCLYSSLLNDVILYSQEAFHIINHKM